jgi:hypothetical protein
MSRDPAGAEPFSLSMRFTSGTCLPRPVLAARWWDSGRFFVAARLLCRVDVAPRISKSLI